MLPSDLPATEQDPIRVELSAIRAEMLAQCGGDMDGLFRAIKTFKESSPGAGSPSFR